MKRYIPSVSFPSIGSAPVETGVSSYADMTARSLKHLAKFEALAKEEAKYQGELAGAAAPIARDAAGRPVLPTGLMEAPTFGTSAKHAAYLDAVKANWRTASRAHTITSITQFNSELRTNTDVPWIGDDDKESKIESFDAMYQAWTEESLAGMPPEEQQGFLAHAQTMYAQTRLGLVNDQFERQQALQIDEGTGAIQTQTNEFYQMLDNLEVPPEDIDAALDAIKAGKYAMLEMFPTKFDGATVQKEIEALEHLAVKSAVSKETFRIAHGIQQSFGTDSTAAVTHGAEQDTHPSENDKGRLFADLMLHLRTNGMNGRYFSEEELNGFEAMFKAEQDRFNAGLDLTMSEAATAYDVDLNAMFGRLQVLKNAAEIRMLKAQEYHPAHWEAYTQLLHQYHLKSLEGVSLFVDSRYDTQRNIIQSHVTASHNELSNVTGAVREGIALSREEQRLNTAMHMAFLTATQPLRVDLLSANQNLPAEERHAFAEEQISALKESVMLDYRQYITGQKTAQPTAFGTGFSVTLDDAFVGLKHGELFDKFLSLKLKYPLAYWSEAAAYAKELRQLNSTIAGGGEVPTLLEHRNQSDSKASLVTREDTMDQIMELEGLLGRNNYIITDEETGAQTLNYPTVSWTATNTQDLMYTFNYNLAKWGQLSKGGISRLTQMLTGSNLDEANTAVYMMQMMKHAFETNGDSHYSDAWKVLYSDPTHEARTELLSVFEKAEYATRQSMRSRPPNFTRSFFLNETTNKEEEAAHSAEIVKVHQQKVYEEIVAGGNFLTIFEKNSDVNTLDKYRTASEQIIELTAAGSLEDAQSLLAEDGMEGVDPKSPAAQHLFAQHAVRELFLETESGRSPVGIWFHDGSLNVLAQRSPPWLRDLLRFTDQNVKVDVDDAWFDKWQSPFRKMGINVSFNETTGRAEHDQFALTRHMKNILWSITPGDRTPVEALLEVFTGAISMPALPTTGLANTYEHYVKSRVADAVAGAKTINMKEINLDFKELYMGGMDATVFTSNIHDADGRAMMQYTVHAPETEMANLVAAGSTDTYAQQIARGDAQMHVMSWVGENYQDLINSTLVIPGQEAQESSPVAALTTDGLRLSYDANATAAANGVPHYSFIIKDQEGLEYESVAIPMTMPKDVKLRSQALRWTEDYLQLEGTLYEQYAKEWPPTVQALVQKQIFQLVNAAMYVDDTWGEEYRGHGKGISNAFTTVTGGVSTLVTQIEFNNILNSLMEGMNHPMEEGPRDNASGWLTTFEEFEKGIN